MRERQKGLFRLKSTYKGGRSTTALDYECTDCVDNHIQHEIIVEPGPPAQGNEVSSKGDPTTIRVCTGCNKYDGPWVPAPW